MQNILQRQRRISFHNDYQTEESWRWECPNIFFYLKKINMNNWFECKIRYEKLMESGLVKKVAEPYLVDAMSFTEAESRIIEEIKPFITGEFTVSNIKRANYSELFFSKDENADRWFSGRLAFITLDERSGKEKKTYTNILVKASDLDNALKNLHEGMKGTMADYNSISLKETPIMDVFTYNSTDNERTNN